MMYGDYWGRGWGWGGSFDNFGGLLLALVILDLVLKGIGLWKSARHGQKYWFVALLLVNSFGILPAIYIKFFQKKGKKK